MATPPSLSKRWLRAALLLLAGWLVLEYALGHLIAERIGWGLTILLLSIKGGLGLLMVGALALGGLKRLGKGGQGPGRGGIDLAFSLASAILITLPGIVPTLCGIALFAPSLRAAILRKFRAPAPEMPRDMDLAPQDWRELRTRRLTRKTKGPARTRLKDAKASSGEAAIEADPPEANTLEANTLEAKPPSV